MNSQQLQSSHTAGDLRAVGLSTLQVFTEFDGVAFLAPLSTTAHQQQQQTASHSTVNNCQQMIFS